MSKKGGYLIIDLKNYDLLTTVEDTSALPIKYCKELFQLLEQNYNKQVLISGITINKIEKNDCVVNINYYDNYYVFDLYGLRIQLSKTSCKCSLGSKMDFYEISEPLNQTTKSVKIALNDFPHINNVYAVIDYNPTTNDSHTYYMYNLPIVKFRDTTTTYTIYASDLLTVTLIVEDDYYNFVIDGTLVNTEHARFHVKLVYLG